ncbi:MAG: hypothetical protein Q6352_018270 [Candidatus Freyrarchaeum guaymaensis]|nr:hypothetical protein [Candidatus Sigynarchaeota archaeon]
MSVDESPLTKIVDHKIVVCAETYDTGGSDTFHLFSFPAPSQNSLPEKLNSSTQQGFKGPAS